jgi:hypothetical protein
MNFGIVADEFGIVADEFGIVADDFGFVTDEFRIASKCVVVYISIMFQHDYVHGTSDINSWGGHDTYSGNNVHTNNFQLQR